jgi:hypothetical protein
VNTGDAAATVTLTQITDDGQETTSVVLAENLAPNAKYLGVFEGLVPENPNSILRIDATENVAILSLRLSKDSRYLYNNNPQ